MILRAKKIKNLQVKVNNYKNNLVIEYLNSKGYDCDNKKTNMIRVNNLLRSNGKKVVIEIQNERLSKSGSYYVWEANIKVKIIDKITGKEI